MKFARTIRFDESDLNIFAAPAEPGEWAIPGGFAFSDIVQADLTGKTRQEFANGWLGLDSFGRSTFVAVAAMTPAEHDAATMRLAAHFVGAWGAPSLEAALPAAAAEIAFMAELCAAHRPNTLLVVERRLEPGGVREAFRVIETGDATLSDVIGAEATAHAVQKLGLK